MSKGIEDLVPEFIRELEPYVPGRPIEEVEREIGMRAVKLASNENPLGPSRKAIEAARIVMGEANRYPDGSGYYLRRALAERLGVADDQLVLGAGSTELIDLIARTLLQPVDEAVTSEGSFPVYYNSTRATGARLVKMPLAGYDFDLGAMAAAVGPHTKVVFLANPNNPTGRMFTADEFDYFLRVVGDDVVVVLDEAYFEYVEREDYSRSIDLVRAGKNVMVLRTFSKVYGLAGMRIGYAAGPAALIGEMNKLRSPFNTSSIAQAAALAALEDDEHVDRSVRMNRAGLMQLSHGLDQLGVAYAASVANFLLVDLGEDARALSGTLLQQGIIVRPMAWMGFPNAIRVSVGTAEENGKFLRAMRESCESRGPAGVRGLAGINPMESGR
jgi:histidinol-phosphate aminotransferase